MSGTFHFSRLPAITGRSSATPRIYLRLGKSTYVGSKQLIAVGSVRHHLQGQPAPAGIVGRTYADREAGKAQIPLATGLQNPPYRIFLGTLSDLGVLDLNRPSQPLREGAQVLGEAWDWESAGRIGRYIHAGSLPDTISQGEVDEAAEALCLCQVPDSSNEQAALRDLFLALGTHFDPPPFAGEPTVKLLPYMATSWRLALELVRRSPGVVLDNERLVGRLLGPDLLDLAEDAGLGKCLLAWRWVAARTLFERGWSLLFNQTLRVLNSVRSGFSREGLRQFLQMEYEARHGYESLGDVLEDAANHWQLPAWSVAHFKGSSPRDLLLLIAAGVAAAKSDLEGTSLPHLESLWRLGPIPLAAENERLLAAQSAGRSASDVWAEVAEETLVRHVQNGLRKLRDGLPDSLLVDFDSGRWVIPGKAMGFAPFAAAAGSRLDIALDWGRQLGLIELLPDGSFNLSQVGAEGADLWDMERASP